VKEQRNENKGDDMWKRRGEVKWKWKLAGEKGGEGKCGA
jgi:hypothetical protein